MPRFAANLSMMFTEAPFLDRFARAKAAGFGAVEFLFPYEHPAEEIARRLRDNGLSQVLFNAPPGDWAAGERGIASLPGRGGEFREGIKRGLEYASALSCPLLHVMAGLAPAGAPRDRLLATYAVNLAWAADECAKAGVKPVIEPINPYDMHGFLLNKPSLGFDLVRELNHPNLKVQYDVYHAQRTEGNVTHTIKQEFNLIGHVQIADSPYRNEPGTGELNYPYILNALDEVGYDGWVGLEYRPANGTEYSLRWLKDFGYWPGQ